MRTQWEISQDAFDKFLRWLDPDREQAGSKYESIRRKLIKLFVCRGCQAGEELADETINRVIRKVPEIAASYTGNPAAYFCGVARNVHLEYVKKNPARGPMPVVNPPDQREIEYECLERCMDKLAPDNRELMLEYYREEKQAKIDHRKELAARLGIAVNALRIRAHRIRLSLQSCVENCLQQET
jgi:DNA-directed RNA polymerase specialized sigma24 family protein